MQNHFLSFLVCNCCICFVCKVNVFAIKLISSQRMYETELICTPQTAVYR